MKLKKRKPFDLILNLFFIAMCACFVIPLLLVVSASFTSEEWLTSGKGFSLVPKEFTMDAYRTAFQNSARMLRAYLVTFAQAGLGTLIA